jgi:hypothetical protein
MMNNADTSKVDQEKVRGALSNTSAGDSRVASAKTELSEDQSKDVFFGQVAEVAEAMIVQHGKEFAIGTLVLAAKFIAEGRPLVKRSAGNGEAASAAKAG